MEEYLVEGEIENIRKYMLGTLLATNLVQNSASIQECSQKLMDFFGHIKHHDSKEAFLCFGIEGLDENSIQTLLTSYINFNQQIQQTHEEKER